MHSHKPAWTYSNKQDCGIGVVRRQRFLGGIGAAFLTTLGIGVGFFCPTPTPGVQLHIIFHITLLSWEFLLKWYCCDRKSPSGMCAKLCTVAASNKRDRPTRSLYYCLFAQHLYSFVLRAHPVRGESHIQRNTAGEVATTSPPFYDEPHRSHVLCAKAKPGTTSTSWSQHHVVAIGKPRAACVQSFALWQQATMEVARRGHSIIACSHHVYIVLFFAHIPFVVNHTFNATPAERFQQYNFFWTVVKTENSCCVRWFPLIVGCYKIVDWKNSFSLC